MPTDAPGLSSPRGFDAPARSPGGAPPSPRTLAVGARLGQLQHPCAPRGQPQLAGGGRGVRIQGAQSLPPPATRHPERQMAEERRRLVAASLRPLLLLAGRGAESLCAAQVDSLLLLNNYNLIIQIIIKPY